MALAERKDTAHDAGLHYATDMLIDVYQKMGAWDDLSPYNVELNASLGGLITHVEQWLDLGYGPYLIALPQLQEVKEELPKLCAKAEGEMEIYWANYFGNCYQLNDTILRDFWYYDNYRDIVQAEIELLRQHAPDIKGFSFVGAGPLPMTVLVAAQLLPDAVFECVDWDKDACAKAQNLIDKFNLAGRIRIVHASAQDYVPPKEMIPIVASLIEGKSAVYDLYKKSGVSSFLVRDAEDIYQFIYKPAEKPVAHDWTEVGSTSLCSTRLNTTRLFRSLKP